MFSSRKFEKMCNDSRKLNKGRGPAQAKLITQRLGELRAAETLEVMRSLPGPRCHELGHNRKGQLTVDLDHPYRLVFVPATDPVSRKPDGGLDWTRVTAIVVLGVEDTHE